MGLAWGWALGVNVGGSSAGHGESDTHANLWTPESISSPFSARARALPVEPMPSARPLDALDES